MVFGKLRGFWRRRAAKRGMGWAAAIGIRPTPSQLQLLARLGPVTEKKAHIIGMMYAWHNAASQSNRFWLDVPRWTRMKADAIGRELSCKFKGLRIQMPESYMEKLAREMRETKHEEWVKRVKLQK